MNDANDNVRRKATTTAKAKYEGSMTTAAGLRRRRQRRKYGNVNDKVRRKATTMTEDKAFWGERKTGKRKGENPTSADDDDEGNDQSAVGSFRTLLVEWFGAASAEAGARTRY